MNPTQHASSGIKLLDRIEPDAYGTGTYTTGWVKAGDHAALMAIVMAGALGSSATIDAKIEQSHGADDTARNSNARDVTDLAITQMTQAGTDQSDHEAVLDVQPGDLDATATHVRLSITVGGAASDVAGILLGAWPRYARTGVAGMASTVAEVVSL